MKVKFNDSMRMERLRSVLDDDEQHQKYRCESTDILQLLQI